MARRIACGNTARWLLGIAVAGLASATLSAQPVFRCRAADGAVAYQDHACAAAQAQSEIAIAPAPPPSPSPDYGRSDRPVRAARAERHSARSRPAAGAERSWQCRGADGSVFYRHSACPKSIAARGGAKAKGIGVTAVPVARAEACRELARAGAVGRNGHEHDEVVPTYERNAGRDPCRYH